MQQYKCVERLGPIPEDIICYNEPYDAILGSGNKLSIVIDHVAVEFIPYKLILQFAIECTKRCIPIYNNQFHDGRFQRILEQIESIVNENELPAQGMNPFFADDSELTIIRLNVSDRIRIWERTGEEALNDMNIAEENGNETEVNRLMAIEDERLEHLREWQRISFACMALKEVAWSVIFNRIHIILDYLQYAFVDKEAEIDWRKRLFRKICSTYANKHVPDLLQQSKYMRSESGKLIQRPTNNINPANLGEMPGVVIEKVGTFLFSTRRRRRRKSRKSRRRKSRRKSRKRI